MESWTSPSVPRLPGSGRPLALFDSSTQQVRPTTPGPEARMYVCGITPYDATHMGHAATYVAFDLVQRAWLDAGHSVHYVQNVTDIDDPLLERAVATGQDWREIAQRETELFRTDMMALGVLAPRDYVGAVESIPSVVRCIQLLRERGAVYAVDNDLYFDITSDSLFGEVSHLDLTAMLTVFGERGGDPDRPGKRHALDPLLWRAERHDEPAWDTELGHGRPGWHIECVAIALDTIGMAFDVQGGGSDLLFPHHEMGASHAEVMTGEWPFARHYVHTGMVGLDGHKMSKSRGNLVFVSRLRESGVDPMAIRLALVAHHYRDDWEWTDAGLTEAQARLERWRAAAALAAGPEFLPTLERVREVLAHDLDAPKALAAIDRWSDEALSRGGRNADAPGLMAQTSEALLGVTLR
ncbi:MAG: cysteine--1-D-myo-inosityl 2-amino-2-deoxy-alpha-D-glucopyranoside ligase [Actinomycetales bacterium mxb001]|nr:MAG: cysteine--1-D-myo-inosityl 2-amino-2-deoxy-alpha-D-glucopyranoside ligase [Actinomycetales bacterium mxb001]